MDAQIRARRVDYIKANLINMSDDVISKIFNVTETIIDDVTSEFDRKHDNDKQLARYHKTMFILINLKHMSRKDLEDVERIVIENAPCEETEENRMHRIALEIMNKIMVVMEREPVDDLCKIDDIDEDELNLIEYKDIIDEYQKYIFDGFPKVNFTADEVTNKYQHMTVIREMLNAVGYDLCSKNVGRVTVGKGTKGNDKEIEDNVLYIRKLES